MSAHAPCSVSVLVSERAFPVCSRTMLRMGPMASDKLESFEPELFPLCVRFMCVYMYVVHVRAQSMTLG